MKQILVFLICLSIGFFQGICPVFAADAYVATKATPDPSPCIKIENLEISGNHAFSSSRLKLRTKIWSTTLMPFKKECLNLDWLKQDKNNLVSFYRKNGFADVVISHEIITRDKESTLRLIIEEGLEYKLEFKGADFFYPWQLKKEIPIFERGNPGDAGLRKSVMNIRKRYIEKGFKSVKVSFTKKKTREKNKIFWKVVFSITENTRMLVRSIDIQGNTYIPTPEIQKEMLLSEKGFLKNNGFNQNLFNDDINAIKRLYLGKGFQNASVKGEAEVEKGDGKPGEKTDEKDPDNTGNIDNAENIDKNNKQKHDETGVHIKIFINENQQTLVNNVEIKGIDGLLDQRKTIETLALKPGKPFRDYMVKSDENTIAAMVSKKGYPHVKVKGELLPEQPSQTLLPSQADQELEINKEAQAKKTAPLDNRFVKLVFKVDPGPFVRVGEISYTGNTRLKKKVMENLLEIKPGDTFSLQEIVNAEKRLRTIRAIQSVRIQAKDLLEKKAVTDLEVLVKEKKPYYVEAALGSDTERLFYINGETGDNNTFGLDIDSWIKAEVSGIGYEAETGIRDPFFMETDMTASLSLFIQKKQELNNDFGVKAWGFSSNLTKPVLPHLNAGVSFSYENRARFGDEEDFESLNSNDIYKTRNILKTSLVLAYDTRDSLIRPRHGILSSIGTDIYKGFGTDLDDFIKYTFDIRQYLSPMQRLTLAFRTRLGYIQPMSSSNEIAEDRLFFLGGTSDVRGFKENLLAYDTDTDPLGGKTMIAASLESRISMTEKIECILFTDTGRLGGTEGNVARDGFRSSIGGGFSYGTIIGPISILYGHKLNPDHGESPGQIHFSFGYTF